MVTEINKCDVKCRRMGLDPKEGKTPQSSTIPNPDPAQHRDMAQTGAGAYMR